MKKGFTLIELLAVIVILAIIALIATPIILGIINDARKESNERSVELYASAVKNAIASYQLTHLNAPTSFSDLDVEYDGEIECATEELYADGSFYIADCTVNGTSVDYIYGTKIPSRYYSWSSGKIGDNLPSDAKPTVSELNPGHPFYLGLDVDSDNKVTSASVCFVINEVEYCLKGADVSAYDTNIDVMKEVYKDILDTTSCTFGDGFSNCFPSDRVSSNVYAEGQITVFDMYYGCTVFADGRFLCELI